MMYISDLKKYHAHIIFLQSLLSARYHCLRLSEKLGHTFNFDYFTRLIIQNYYLVNCSVQMRMEYMHAIGYPFRVFSSDSSSQETSIICTL